MPRWLYSVPLLMLAMWSADGATRVRSAITEAPPAIVPSYPLTLTLAMGQNSFAADMIWLRALEYFGDSRFRKLGFNALVGYLNLATELDPKFCVVYRKAGLMLTTNEIADISASNRLLMRGTHECPDDGFIPFVHGFNLYFFQRKFKEAGYYLQIAAQRPGAPEWLPELALRVSATGGDLNVLEGMMIQMREAEEDESLQKTLDRRIAYVRTERMLQLIEKVHAELPNESLEALVASGKLPKQALHDALGGKITLTDKGAVSETFPRRLVMTEDTLFHEVWKEGDERH